MSILDRSFQTDELSGHFPRVSTRAVTLRKANVVARDRSIRAAKAWLNRRDAMRSVRRLEPRAGQAGVLDQWDDEGPIPTGLFRRCKRKKLLGWQQGDGDGRIIEIDIIVASPDTWADCEEAREDGWDAVEIDGLIMAERTIG